MSLKPNSCAWNPIQCALSPIQYASSLMHCTSNLIWVTCAMQCFIQNRDLWDGKVGDMMLLGWESNISKVWQKSAKVEGGNLILGVGNPTFCIKHCYESVTNTALWVWISVPLHSIPILSLQFKPHLSNDLQPLLLERKLLTLTPSMPLTLQMNPSKKCVHYKEWGSFCSPPLLLSGKGRQLKLLLHKVIGALCDILLEHIATSVKKLISSLAVSLVRQEAEFRIDYSRP